MSSYFQIPITGRLIDPVGDPVTGASVFFRAKATSRGLESVPKTTVASFETDSNGYYQTSIPSGWYSIEFSRPGDLDSTKLGAATVTGVQNLDLGTLLANSIPPPSQLEGISDVSISGRQNGSLLVWNSSRTRWETTIATGQLATASGLASTAANLAATGANLQSQVNTLTGQTTYHWARFPQTIPPGFTLSGFNALLVGTVASSGSFTISNSSTLSIV